MSAGQPARGALLAAACSLAGSPASFAQVGVTADLGVSTVRYEEFLPSGAVSFTPAIAYQGRTATVSARGTYLAFESGNTTWQALIAGSAFTAPVGALRPELWLSAGGSRYIHYPGFWHAMGGARLHLPVRLGTAWLDGSLGRTSFGTAARPVAVVGAGVWTRRYGPTLALAAGGTWVGDTTYADLQGTARGARGRAELTGVLGARLWSRGGGRGVFGEATVVLPLGNLSALVLAGGRYPSDPTHGTISGRYASAALRFTAFSGGRRPTPTRPAPVVLAGNGAGSPRDAAAPSLEALSVGDGTVRLLVHAPHAVSVEIAGDFTDWEPVALWPAETGTWQLLLRIRRGAHRVNVRLDGGSWIVPRGATITEDDFGGKTGIVIVP